MEVPYRNTKLLVKIIPKGTVLFRITDTPENDLRGIPVDGKRCVTPTFNVFFHPFIEIRLISEIFRININHTTSRNSGWTSECQVINFE